MLRTLFLSAALLGCLLVLAPGLRAGERAGDWAPLAILRFGDVDAIDAEDGELASFLKSIRNDGRFIPPLHTLIGPRIRNSTFFGLTYEAWLEGVVLVPSQPGELQLLWVFPVDNRDEYMLQLVNHGLSEYEGMDGVTILREMDADGNVHTWHMEWLPGNVAIFGAHRDAVAAAKQIYAENAASRGLLDRSGGRYVKPDLMVRLEPARLVSWQDSEYGQYWWRDKIILLTSDLLGYWQPNAARGRLVHTLSEALILWPRSLGTVDLSLWFEREGVEVKLDVVRDSPFVLRGDLDTLRRIPERSALAYAMPVSPASFLDMAAWVGNLLLGAAGGVVSQDARATALSLFDSLGESGLREATTAWVPPPTGRPDLGGSRLMVLEWSSPAPLAEAWRIVQDALRPDTPVAHALAQIGWAVSMRGYGGDPGAVELEIRPTGEGDPYYYASYVCRRDGNLMALVGGAGRRDARQMRQVMEYRASLAEEVVSYGGEGGADVRNVFSRMGAGGASLLGLFEPVRFLQLCLVEAADWRPRSPDQHEPVSTQLAREMLEYSAGRAWSVAGETEPHLWRFEGSIAWQSLSRLAAALGITESVSMEQ